MSNSLILIAATASLSMFPADSVDTTTIPAPGTEISAEAAPKILPVKSGKIGNHAQTVQTTQGQGETTRLTNDSFQVHPVSLTPRLALRLTNRIIPSLERIEGDLEELRLIALEAADESVEPSFRSAIGAQTDTQLRMMDNYIEQTTLGDKSPLRGELADATILTMLELTEDVPLLYKLPDVSTSTIGLGLLSFGSASDALAASVSIEEAMSQVETIRLEQRMLRSRLVEVEPMEHGVPGSFNTGGHAFGLWMDQSESCEIIPKVRKENDGQKEIGTKLNEVARAGTDPSLSDGEREALSDKFNTLKETLLVMDENAFGWLGRYPQYGQLNYALTMVPHTANQQQIGYAWTMTYAEIYDRQHIPTYNLDTVENAIVAYNYTEQFLSYLVNYPRELDIMKEFMCAGVLEISP